LIENNRDLAVLRLEVQALWTRLLALSNEFLTRELLE